MSEELRALRAQPFLLLLELDRRLRAMRAGGAEGGVDVWQGLAFRLGERWLVTPKDDVREVIPPPRLTRVPNARPWLSGVANVRGSLLTVVDSGRLLSEQASGEKRTARVLVLNSERLPAGFLVDEVAGYRQFTVRDQGRMQTAQTDAAAPYLLGCFQRDGRIWPVLSLHRLAQADVLRRAGW